jgi:membrane protease YdiL (CAAX protease family)
MTGMFMALGLKGMGGTFAAYGLLGWILWIWIMSSVVEEIFCRAWFQTLLGPETRRATIWSAALFGTMHLPLLFSEMHVVAVMILLVSVTALGYICATARARTGSLRPAVFAHVLFNVGGLVAGVIYTIAYRIATGHLPQM